MKTYTYKRFKYKDKFYKFKEPLKVQINNFLCYDLKTMGGELSIPSIQDGYTKKEEITNPEKEIKWYLTYIFDNYLIKKDDELDDADRAFRDKFMKLIDFSKK